MNKIYHQVGTVMGRPVLIELNDTDKDKAEIWEFIQAGGFPKWISVDPKPVAKLFEKEYPRFEMPTLAQSTPPREES